VGNVVPSAKELRLFGDGSFAQYAIGQADYVARIPKNLSFVDAAPILVPELRRIKIERNRNATRRVGVISGVGGLGHIAIQYAKAMGLHVVAVDLGPEKMALHVSLELKSRLMRKRRIRLQRSKADRRGARRSGDAVSTTAFKQAIGMLRRGGTCVLNGLPPESFRFPSSTWS